MKFVFIYKILLFIGVNYCVTSWRTKYHGRHPILLKNSAQNNCIISSKNKKSYCDMDANLYLDKHSMHSGKKLITISPGGCKGFYLLGILAFIKENYRIEDCIFSGASAGSWNSLFMCYKGDTLSFVYNFLDENIRRAKTITELQYFFKYKLLSAYKESDFDLSKLFIGVTTFRNFSPRINIYSDFEDLEDAINCCMASSHIPLITGGLTNRYKNMFSFDGGFSNNPYLNKEKLLHISPSMWNDIKENTKSIKRNVKTLFKFSEFFSISKNNLLELFDNGYQDAKKNREYLDTVLDAKQDEDVPEF